MAFMVRVITLLNKTSTGTENGTCKTGELETFTGRFWLPVGHVEQNQHRATENETYEAGK